MLGNYQQITRKASATTSSTAITFVALYFLLLAFFIYLNSISEPVEEKVQSVIGSIDVAFKGKEKVEQDPDVIRFKSDQLGTAIFHAELKQVYEAAIPLVKSEVNEKGDILQFRVPLSQLFSSASAELRDNRNELLAETAATLIKRSSQVPTDMEMLMSLKSELPSPENLNGNLPIKRLNNLVEGFVAQGVPARNVFIGISNEGGDEVLFKFYIRDSFNNQFRKEAAK